MKLDLLGLSLHEALLLALAVSSGSGLWASIGRLEVGLCRLFKAAYPARKIQHFTAKNWANLSASGGNPGAFLLNLDLDIASIVISYAASKGSFCLVGLHAAGSKGLETLLANMPLDVGYFELLSIDQFHKPLRLLSAGKPARLILSLSKEYLGQTGDLLGVRL